MVACMVPKGNMMHCMVRETGGELKQIKYNITAKELPVEIMGEQEADLLSSIWGYSLAGRRGSGPWYCSNLTTIKEERIYIFCFHRFLLMTVLDKRYGPDDILCYISSAHFIYTDCIKT